MSTFLERAQQQAKTAESRYATGRFVATVVVLAVLVQVAPLHTVGVIVLKVFLFFAFFALSSYIHTLFKKRVSFWEAFAKSWGLSQARQNRDFETLTTHKPPWVVVPQAVKNSCLSDLDAVGHLGLLLDTCFSQKGSSTLLGAIDQNTHSPEAPEVIQKRQGLAKVLTKFPSLLRRLELLRLQKQVPDTSHDAFGSDESGNVTYKASLKPVLWYGLFSVGVWLGMVVFLTIRGFELSITYQAIFAYLFVAAVGTGLFGLFFRWFLIASQPLKDFWDVQKQVFDKISLAKRLPEELKQNWPSLNGTGSGSHGIRTSQALQNLLRSRQNPLFWLLAHIFVPLDAVLALVLFFLSARLSQGLQNLESCMCDFDVAAAIARFQYENRECRFVDPQFLDQNQRLEVKTMGHPLLPATGRICNDLLLTQDAPVVLLTGSNMAGKSTFLRALGLNAVLAHLGAPVCAEVFIFPRSHLLCAIKIEDSLEENTSYFYAEVKRLKEIFSTLRSQENHLPCVFFVDEIFKGTNNTERFIGSWYILKALFETKTFGFVSTHDLVLTRLAQFDPRLVNMHFREHVEDDHLLFDYTLRPGPCTSSNALRIMRLEGLPIPENTEEAQALLT